MNPSSTLIPPTFAPEKWAPTQQRPTIPPPLSRTSPVPPGTTPNSPPFQRWVTRHPFRSAGGTKEGSVPAHSSPPMSRGQFQNCKLRSKMPTPRPPSRLWRAELHRAPPSRSAVPLEPSSLSLPWSLSGWRLILQRPSPRLWRAKLHGARPCRVLGWKMACQRSGPPHVTHPLLPVRPPTSCVKRFFKAGRACCSLRPQSWGGEAALSSVNQTNPIKTL